MKAKIALPALAAVLSLVASGCASTSRIAGPAGGTVESLYSHAARVLSSEELARFSVPFEINDELRELAEKTRRFSNTPFHQAKQIAFMMLDDGELGIQYRRDRNATALEAVALREANCISYTNLFVGMARSQGLRVSYVEVSQVSSFDKVGDSVVFNSHICAIVTSGSQSRIVDFSFYNHPQYRSARVLTDLEAAAHFYNNIGSHYLLERTDPDRFAQAELYLGLARKLWPDTPQVHNNIGVLLLQQGDLEGARAAFNEALRIEPGYFAAYNNLAGIHARQGRIGRAIELLRQAVAAEPENPFGRLTLAKLCIQVGSFEAAEDQLRQALDINEHFSAARHELGRLYLRQGRGREALEQFSLALKYMPEDNVARSKVDMIRQLALDSQ